MTKATTQQENHYTILSLAPPSSTSAPLSLTTLKAAYHRALLQNHPDKTTTVSFGGPTVDDIKQAYVVLSDPITRAKHDRELALQAAHFQQQSSFSAVNVSEHVDLEDLSYDDAASVWTRACIRCGAEKGFVVRENDLERAASEGEVQVQCVGCSLWLGVEFAMMDTD
jgi:diphthamide biosynthesis protein 4